MDLGIRGKRALVAGGSAGLGGASAWALAREGAVLTLSARGADRLDATAAAIRAETGADVTTVVADHGTEDGRARLTEACPEPDILVISVSPPPSKDDYKDISVAEWQASIDATMLGPIELMRRFSPGMAERGYGRIVNIGTVAAKYPAAQRMLSGPTRSAVANYANALSKRLARHDVAVNCLLPGLFTTPGLEASLARQADEKGVTPEEIRQTMLGRWRIPAKRLGEPSEFGDICAMFCSRQVGFVIGQSLVVDGGLGSSVF